ncbi:Protein RTM1 [Elsinoe australis]|uniref:Protein RTM1 n=1 Tax=Elsinoe australis TaxID=40998 RepID=A0A2P8A0P5_9PEZI|nr:Protein RTM1 [Elsinoe australis]
MTSTTSTPPTSTSTGNIGSDCVTATPGKYGNVPISACNSYYNFNPEFAPAVAVTVLFGILTIAHLVLAIMYRKKFCWVIIMGATWEFVSFAAHAAGAHDQQNIGLATSHQILFLLAPLWINASVYMTFARMVHYFLPDKKIWRIRGVSLAKYFVWADIVAFIVQAVGGIMVSPGSSPEIIKTGINIYMGGIGLQEAFILCFIGLMVHFHRSALHLERVCIPVRDHSWRPILYALYAVLVAITVRIVYRIAEYAGGIKPSNPVPFHEVYSYALDAFPMMVAILLIAIFHPGRYLVGPDSEFIKVSRKEKKAIKMQKREEKKAEKLATKQSKQESV